MLDVFKNDGNYLSTPQYHHFNGNLMINTDSTRLLDDAPHVPVPGSSLGSTPLKPGEVGKR